MSGSGHTRDLRSDVIDSPDILSRIPGIARSVFTPRVSSVADFALSVETTTRVGPLSATATFRNIGPGYTSLGVGSLQNDLREAGLRTQLRFRRWNVRVDGARQHDNLVGQKTLTTNRDRLAASLSVRPGRTWNASLTTQYSRLGNNAPQREQLIAYTSLMVGTNQTITFSRRGLLRNASVQYQFRSTGDDNPMRVQSTSRSHSVNARLLLSPARILNVTPTVGIVRSRFAEMGWSTRQTYGLGAQLRVMNGKLMSAFQLGRSQINQTTATQFSANARYQLTRHDMLILSVRASDFANALEASRNFQEGQVSLRWSRRL